jgi:hypothetical protein
MIVSELIKLLEPLPPDTPVYAEDSDTWEAENPVVGTYWKELSRVGQMVVVLQTDK